MKKKKKKKSTEQATASMNYISVGLDVAADFTWMSIALPDKTFVGKPYKIIHSDPSSREYAVAKIKEAQDTYSLEARCFLESTGVYHIPVLCFLRDNGFACQAINPIITKSSTNMNIRKQKNDRSDSKNIALLGLDSKLKTSIVPDEEVVALRNLVRNYYRLKDAQTAIVLRLTGILRTSFPGFLGVFSKITTQTAIKLLNAYPTAESVLAADKNDIVALIQETARFGASYALKKYNALRAAAEDARVFGRPVPSDSVLIRSDLKLYQDYQEAVDSLLASMHDAVDSLHDQKIRDRIDLLQSLRGVGFLSAVALIAEIGDFDIFHSPRQLYAYFGLDPTERQSGKFTSDQAHVSKRGSPLVRRVLRMIALNNLKVEKGTEQPVNPVIHDYYAKKCSSKKKSVALGAVMHKICNIIFAMLRDNTSYRMITPEEHIAEHDAKSAPTPDPVA